MMQKPSYENVKHDFFLILSYVLPTIRPRSRNGVLIFEE